MDDLELFRRWLENLSAQATEDLKGEIAKHSPAVKTQIERSRERYATALNLIDEWRAAA